MSDHHRHHYDYVVRELSYGEYEPHIGLLASALLAVADAIAAHNRPIPTVESPATGVPDTPPAPVGVGSVLDGNPTVVAAILDTLPKEAVVIDRDGVVHQRRHAGWWRTAEGPVRSSDSRSVAVYAPLTVLRRLPEAGGDDE